jgi:hypothetical protein
LHFGTQFPQYETRPLIDVVVPKLPSHAASSAENGATGQALSGN